MLAVQVGGLLGGDEELGAVRARPGVGHAQQTWRLMLRRRKINIQISSVVPINQRSHYFSWFSTGKVIGQGACSGSFLEWAVFLDKNGKILLSL